jgi:hypothetical protein
MELDEYKICYFCEDKKFTGYNFFIKEHKGIWICQEVGCYECIFNEAIHISENIECLVCYEIKTGIKLPNCSHIICIDCCKFIYCGFTDVPKPIFVDNEHFNLDWPYELKKDSEGNDDYENDDKLVEYEKLEDDYYNKYMNKTYEEIIKIRDELVETRPNWMNTEEFITWENQHIKYWVYMIKKDNEEDNYKKSKLNYINSQCCPLCRK